MMITKDMKKAPGSAVINALNLLRHRYIVQNNAAGSA
jgi:hypothetical protein